jgi:hypothetical protein
MESKGFAFWCSPLSVSPSCAPAAAHSCTRSVRHGAVQESPPRPVSHRISLLAMSDAAFAKSLPARPPGLKVSRPPLLRLRYGLVTRRHPYNGVVGRLQNHGFPTDPATQATGLRLLPRWDCLPQNAPAFAGRTTTASRQPILPSTGMRRRYR